MNERKGNIWSAYMSDGIIVVPSCSTLTPNGRLVMARGLARQVNEAHPGVDAVFGLLIKRICGNEGYFYWLYRPDLAVAREEYAKFALLQTKRRYKNGIDLELTAQSLWSVRAVAEYVPDREVHITNIIGADLSSMPDNVTVWKR
jgi:hypothetical protein